MTSPAVGRGPDPVVLNNLAALLGSHFDEEQRVVGLGFYALGNDTLVRFRASRACQFVTVHVQHSGQAGGSTLGLFARGLNLHEKLGLFARGLGVGGGVSYDPSNPYTSSRVDCRSDRQQEVTVTRDGSNQFVVYLIPEFLEVDGTYTKYDGVDSDDHMAILDIGT